MSHRVKVPHLCPNTVLRACHAIWQQRGGTRLPLALHTTPERIKTLLASMRSQIPYSLGADLVLATPYGFLRFREAWGPENEAEIVLDDVPVLVFEIEGDPDS